mmetsp:Transcript_60988/g.188891  ORF Transcript_60988/g.188891 Transcript_60988/m.188891 type:complete len:414 (+) Transcript_60988:1187-2428(+)
MDLWGQQADSANRVLDGLEVRRAQDTAPDVEAPREGRAEALHGGAQACRRPGIVVKCLREVQGALVGASDHLLPHVEQLRFGPSVHGVCAPALDRPQKRGCLYPALLGVVGHALAPCHEGEDANLRSATPPVPPLPDAGLAEAVRASHVHVQHLRLFLAHLRPLACDKAVGYLHGVILGADERGSRHELVVLLEPSSLQAPWLHIQRLVDAISSVLVRQRCEGEVDVAHAVCQLQAVVEDLVDAEAGVLALHLQLILERPERVLGRLGELHAHPDVPLLASARVYHDLSEGPCKLGSGLVRGVCVWGELHFHALDPDERPVAGVSPIARRLDDRGADCASRLRELVQWGERLSKGDHNAFVHRLRLRDDRYDRGDHLHDLRHREVGEERGARNPHASVSRPAHGPCKDGGSRT